MKKDVELAFEEWAISEVEKEMNRRRGYAEKEGLAILKRERAKARKQEAIGIGVAGVIALTFFWICYALWVNGGIS